MFLYTITQMKNSPVEVNAMNWRLLQCVESVEKGKKILPLTSLMGTKDLQGCWSRNESWLSWVSQVLFTTLLQISWRKVNFQRCTFHKDFSDKFQVLPPVVPALNLMSSSIQIHRTATYLYQSSLEKISVHQTCWIWTTPEIKLWKSTTRWIFY